MSDRLFATATILGVLCFIVFAIGMIASEHSEVLRITASH